MTLHRRDAWVLLLLVFFLLGGVSPSPSAGYSPEEVVSGAKTIAAGIGVLTAVLFMYSDSTPAAKDEAKRARQLLRRDRAKLFTHGSVIGIAFFVFAATATGNF